MGLVLQNGLSCIPPYRFWSRFSIVWGSSYSHDLGPYSRTLLHWYWSSTEGPSQNNDGASEDYLFFHSYIYSCFTGHYRTEPYLFFYALSFDRSSAIWGHSLHILDKPGYCTTPLANLALLRIAQGMACGCHASILCTMLAATSRFIDARPAAAIAGHS